MDVEMARTVALLSGSLSLAGALLGGLIAGVVNYVVARQNRATQVALAEQERATKLALAQDAARREWRKQQLTDLLNNANTRIGLYTSALIYRDEGDAEGMMLQIRRLSESAPISALGWIVGHSTPLRTAVNAYIAADTAYLQQVLNEGTEAQDAESEDSRTVYRDLIAAIRTLNQTAEQYIFSTEEPP